MLPHQNPQTKDNVQEESHRQSAVGADLKSTLPARIDVEQSTQEIREMLKLQLPEDHSPYIDKYFLRSKEILEKEGLNPYIRAQVFIRKGPGQVHGINEALAALDKYSDLAIRDGAVYAKNDGEHYDSGESLMFIDGYVQDIIELETFYLGCIASQTTRINDQILDVDLKQVQQTMAAVVKATNGRPVQYFGARHWDFRQDAAIANAAFAAGAVGASTDIGAKTAGLEGGGTIPHALENIFALYHGKDRAVVEATLAFDRHIDPAVPRIALIDYNNKEIDDALATATALNGRLSAVRVDTCGENIAQGALASLDSHAARAWREEGLYLPKENDPDAPYWFGSGVKITGVYRLRIALDRAGFKDVQIVLTSGFGNPKKVEAFVRAEQKLGIKLFDGLGVGGVYSPCRASTMDIVLAGESPKLQKAVSKAGRSYKPNDNLKLQLGGNLAGTTN